MFLFKKRPTIDNDELAWIAACWRWLDDILGPVDKEPRRQAILPSRRLFPDTEYAGHKRAQYYFDLVRRYSGAGDGAIELMAQAPAPELGDSIVFAERRTSKALGTFRQSGNAAVITYDPAQLKDPIQLVATLVHELAHYLLLRAASDPPGGAELEELATDLATVHLGFGLFGANAAFNFKQTTDFDRQGWSTQRSGYMPENMWAFAFALFAEILSLDAASYSAYAKASVNSQLTKNRAYFAANPSYAGALKRAGAGAIA